MHMPPPVHGAAMVGKYIHDSELVNSEFDCFYINPTTAKNLEDVGKFRFGKLQNVFKLIKQIKAMVREKKPEVVYFTPNANGLPFYKDFLIVRTLKQMGCKVVIHYHNKGVSTRQSKWFDDALYKRFFKDIKVILLAEALYEDIKKYVKREDVMICGNGIPDLYDNKMERLCNIHSLSAINILYFSNMMTEKGVWTLVDACSVLHDKGIKFECHFVGRWMDITESTFRNCIKTYGLQDCVFSHGAKYGTEKEPFFANADIMVLPTYYRNECFPLVLLEGMMHGLACISTNEGGIPDIIDNNETGLIVEKQDAQALADAIEWMINHPEERKRMGEKGREKFLKEYTIERFEERFVETISHFMA